MRSCRYTPAAPLAAFVHCFWYWEGAPQKHSKEKLLPNGESAADFQSARPTDQDLRRARSDQIFKSRECGFVGCARRIVS